MSKAKPVSSLLWILIPAMVLFVYLFYKGVAQQDRGIGEGQAAPLVSVTTATGEAVSLASLQGKVVLLHFWATWCGPCKDELPTLEAFMATLKDNPAFVPLLVSEDLGGAADTEPFRKRYGIQAAFHYDPDAKAADAFGSSRIPETYLIRRSGTVVKKWTGPVNWADPAVAAVVKDTLLSIKY